MSRSSNRGSILLLVLIVAAMLTLASLSLFQRMFAEHRGTRIAGERLQSQMVCESAAEYLQVVLSETPESLDADGGTFDNAELFRGILFQDDAVDGFRSRFAIVSPGLSNDGEFSGIRFGVEDESARLNLNIVLAADALGDEAAREMLMPLPGMTANIADAILDWIDDDSEPRALGAERDYYSTLASPYLPDDGPIASIDRLLLVRGVTPALLYGGDVNHNFMQDAGEAPGSGTLGTTSNRGWAAYLTVQSGESNLRPDGTPKIDVNGEDLQALQSELATAVGDELANFIIAYRQSGPYSGSDAGTSAASAKIDYNQPANNTITSLLDIVGAKTTLATESASQGPGGGRGAPGGGGGQPATILESPVSDSAASLGNYLVTLFENLTTSSASSLPGRLNINQAPLALLQGLPGLDTGVANQIVGARDVRPRPERPQRAYAAWLLAEGIVDLEQMRQIEPLITGGGAVWRAQCVAYYDGDGAPARAEVLIDASQSPAELLFYRDLTDFGPGFSRALLGVESPAETP